MDHKAFLKSLSPDQRTALTEQSNSPALVHLNLHWGLIIGFAAYIGLKLPYWYLLLIPQGILISFCFCLLHETIHNTPFKSNKLNTIIGTICAYMVFLPRNWFRYFHLAHHKYTHQQGKDPELNAPKPETLGQYLGYATGLPTLFGNIKKIAKNAYTQNNDPYVPENSKAALKKEAIWMLECYIFLMALYFLLDQTWIFRCWLLPYLIGQPFLRLYLLAEHGRCPMVANMFENSRTTFTNRIVRFLAWNMPYHAEHHAYPTVPFHKLPLLHRLAADSLKSTSDGYIEFHEGYLQMVRKQ